MIRRRDDGTAEIDETEAFAVLKDLADGKSGGMPPGLLAGHVLRVTEGADWGVRRAALEAALRRIASCAAEEMRVARRPGGGAPFGAYATRRRGGAVRPYATHLRSLEPLEASCDCRDFLRNSLGLCKHVVAVVEDLAARPRKVQRALAEGMGRDVARFVWDPVRALTGDGDWMDGVRMTPGVAARSAAWRRAAGHFAGRRLHRTHARDPKRRLALVADLAAAVRGDGADPALGALLAREHARLRDLHELRDGVHDARRGLRTLRRRLYPYQKEGVERFLASGALLLGDDMGLGKTAQAIAACHALFAAGSVRRGLLIVPASLKPQWLREWRLFSDAPIDVVEGGPSEREVAYRKTRKGFLVANYEQVLRDLEHMAAWKPDLAVLDEAQRIKNWATKTATYVKRLRPRFRLVLTGTPMENRLAELASLMDWVDDTALEPKWRLGPWHTVYADGAKTVVGARNLDTLRSRLAPTFVRRVRADVLKQLPPRTDTAVPVEMTPAQFEAHEGLKMPIARLMKTAERRPLTPAEFLKLMALLTTQRIICNGLAQLEFRRVWPDLPEHGPSSEGALNGLDSPKLAELREIVRQVAVEQGRKVVVFSQWRRMLQLAEWSVRDLLAEHGLRASFFTGRESQRRRTRNLVEFHDDPDSRVLFLSDAGGVGLNLQRASNCCVNLELPWNPAVLEQRIGRIHRLGQDDPIDVYNLVAQGGIEERIAQLVSDKRALFKGLFDGTSDEVRFEGAGSFLDGLRKLVSAPAVPDLPDDAEPDADDGIEDVLAAADESRDELSAADAEPLPAPDGVRELFGRLHVTATDGGGLRIDAPPEAAERLASLFEGFAALLRRSAASASPGAAGPPAEDRTLVPGTRSSKTTACG